MKIGSLVWIFIPCKGGRKLDYGVYVRKHEGICTISVGRKIYRRKITEIAQIHRTDKEKFLVT